MTRNQRLRSSGFSGCKRRRSRSTTTVWFQIGVFPIVLGVKQGLRGQRFFCTEKVTSTEVVVVAAAAEVVVGSAVVWGGLGMVVVMVAGREGRERGFWWRSARSLREANEALGHE
ncbi:hypothetical protein L1987_35153 [Smallanthus sonchifolius]|uniref:Uncharacterized protein n=1 Tax=Smallanthus sonchifolius TaxID=185202 RepID=A0ACB9HVT9_9ASTR|nr:hypothetical protein L1987_35153 [Smallanthus sonchifolius]